MSKIEADDDLDGVLQNDGLLDVVQQLSHALEEAAKTEDEMRIVNAALHRNEKDQTAEMAQLQGAVAIQRNATLSTKWMLSREKVPPVPAPLLIRSTVKHLCRDFGVHDYRRELCLAVASPLHALAACSPWKSQAVHSSIESIESALRGARGLQGVACHTRATSGD